MDPANHRESHNEMTIGKAMSFPFVLPNRRHKKTAFEGGFSPLLIIDFILVFPWCPERDLNSHSAYAEGF